MTDLPADLTADQLVTLPAEADVVICGAGPIGAATATFLARPGLRVVLVDHDPAEDPDADPRSLNPREGRQASGSGSDHDTDPDSDGVVFRSVEGVEPPPVELAGSGSEGSG